MARPTNPRKKSTSSSGFTPEQLAALSGLVERSTYKKKLKETGTKTPWFKKLFSFLQTGQTSSAVYAALEGKNPLEEYGRSVLRDMSGKGYDDKTYADVLEKIGMPKWQISAMLPGVFSDTGQGIKLKKNGFLDFSARGTLGLLGDIVLNPTTYLTGGGLFAQANKGRNLTKAGQKILSESQSKIDDILKIGGDDAAKKVDEISRNTTSILNKNKDLYYTGVKFMGKEVLPRKVALAPGRFLDGTLSKTPILNGVYTGAKAGIQDVFKYGADVIRNGAKLGDAGKETAESYVLLKQKLPKRQRELLTNTYDSLKELQKEFKKNVPKGTREEFRSLITKNMEGAITDLGIAPEAKGDFINKLLDSFKEYSPEFAKTEKESIGKLAKDPMETIVDYVYHMPTKEAQNWLAKKNSLSFRGRAISSSANFEKGRVLSEFENEVGEKITAKPEALGWKPYSKKAEADFILRGAERLVTTQDGYLKSLMRKVSRLTKDQLNEALRPTTKITQKVAKLNEIPKGAKSLVKAGKSPTGLQLFREYTRKTPKYSLKTAELKPSETMKFVEDLINLPKQSVVKLGQKIALKEDKIARVWKQIQDITSEAQTKIKELPTESLWWKDSEGKIWKRTGTAKIDELNKIMNKEGFKGKFFETDPFLITYGRGALSARKIAANEFYNSVLDTFGKKGIVAKQYIRNPNTRKQTIDKVVLEEIDPLTNIKYADPKNSMFPEGTLLPDFIVSDLNKSKELFDNDKVSNKLLTGYDKIINEWKGTVYGWYPASHGRNLIGALYNNWLAGLNPLNSSYKEGLAIIRGADGFITTNSGVKIPYETIRKQILAKGVIGQAGSLDAVRFYKEFDPSNFHKVRNLPVTAMEAVENSIRTPLFIKSLKEGDSFDDAAKQVFKYHFDYAPEALTDFEKNVLRRIIPFYRWTRGNIPLMLQQMIEQPGKITGTFRALNQASDKEGKLQMDLLPDFLQSDVTINRGGETISGLGIPPVQMFQWMKDADNQFLSGITPFLKIPIELKTGFNTFKEKAILDDDSGNFAEKYPQALKDWLQYDEKEVTKKDGTKFTIKTVDPMRKYWLYALPTGKLASMLSSTMGEDEKNKILYNISGIKTFQYDMQRLKETQESNFEKAIIDILVGEGIMGEIPYIYADSKSDAGLDK